MAAALGRLVRPARRLIAPPGIAAREEPRLDDRTRDRLPDLPLDDRTRDRLPDRPLDDRTRDRLPDRPLDDGARDPLPARRAA